MVKLPIDFYSDASASGEFEKSWAIKSGPVNAVCDIPTEFGGLGAGFSPEDLFLQAIMNCFIGTFKVYAKASRINFAQLDLAGQLTVDQDQERKTFMKKVFLNIQIKGVEKRERIETIVAKTMRDGFILNSVKTEINYKIEIN